MNLCILYILIGILAGGGTLAVSPAFALQQGMEVSLSAAEGSTTISVIGWTSIVNEAVTITVKSPNGNLVTIDQVTPDSTKNFMKEIQTNSILWKQDGVYTITVQQGERTLYKFSFPVQVVGGTTLATEVSDSTVRTLLTGGATGEDFRGLTIIADAVIGSTTIGISGHTDRTNDITIVVTAPNGNVVSVDQITPNADGSFMTEIKTNSVLWKQDGFYTLTAQQGEGSAYKDSVQVEIGDGVVIPEFGTIAALIFAVAIISIIAVSAKTRLKVLPKY